MNDTNLLEHQPIAWTPTDEIIERAQLTKFMRQVGVNSFDELYRYSIENVEGFTAEVLKFLDIKFDPPYKKLLDTTNGIEFPNWCEGAGLNITEMCLDRWQTDEMKDQPAIIWEGENGKSKQITYRELLWKVGAVAAGLRFHGLGKGDAIGIHLPMTFETVEALLAINRIGAIAVPIFSGYGVEAIASRLFAIGAKALITCDQFPRRGKNFHAYAIAAEAASQVSTVKKFIVVERETVKIDHEAGRYVGCGTPFLWERRNWLETKDKRQSERILTWTDLWKDGQHSARYFFRERLKKVREKIGSIERGKTKLSASLTRLLSLVDKSANQEFNSEPTFAEDPLIILYTSGTTGKPKGIAHTHLSFPIKAAQDMAFGTDVGKGTRISWITDLGWMMGPWLIYGALINGATICLYDGAPDYPNADRMWEFAAKHKVEIMGISPTLIRSLSRSAERSADIPVRHAENEKPSTIRENPADNIDNADFAVSGEADRNVRAPFRAPFQKHDLSSLRAFASTGEPWNPAPWWWLFEKVGDGKLPIINYSGGTEISGGILMNNFLTPIKPCGFSAACPGMDVDILDENGKSVAAGEVGELVIRQPWIGMARGFWGEKERYLETYWSRFENIWVHGDFAMRDADGHYFILGRSDDTLKVAGKRVGPAEVESLLVAHPFVTEAAVIGVPDDIKGTAMVAFVVLKSEPTENLAAELKQLVAKDMGKPLAPSLIHFVSAIPKTRNGKVMRRVIRAAYLGEDAGDLSALENPSAVEEIRQISQN